MNSNSNDRNVKFKVDLNYLNSYVCQRVYKHV